MENRLSAILASINEYEPIPWDALPNFGLYMDQVIMLITQMYEPLYGKAAEKYISSSMINNYVKSKLIPRPTGKKYNREQIALLIMIVSLKHVSTMEEIRRMLIEAEDIGIMQLYTLFCARQKATLHALVSELDPQTNDLPPALDYAIVASGYHVSSALMLAPENDHDPDRRKADR